MGFKSCCYFTQAFACSCSYGEADSALKKLALFPPFLRVIYRRTVGIGLLDGFFFFLFKMIQINTTIVYEYSNQSLRNSNRHISGSGFGSCMISQMRQ